MSHLNSFTSQQILFLILGLVIVVLLLIFTLKWYLRNLSNENLKERFKDFVWASPLTARNKYPLVVVEDNDSRFKFSPQLSE
jgi:flagellar biogenesis protein FliO